MRSAQWNIIVRKLEGSGEKLSRQWGGNEVCMYSGTDTVQPMAMGHREGGMKMQCGAAVKRAAVVLLCVGLEIVFVMGKWKGR